MRREAGYFEALAILCSKWPVSWSRLRSQAIEMVGGPYRKSDNRRAINGSANYLRAKLRLVSLGFFGFWQTANGTLSRICCNAGA
jgi:hypothetical protein